MKTLDRYIIRQFLLNYVILFIAMVTLILLLELIVNLDEFGQAAQRVEGNWFDRVWQVVGAGVDYFAPMIPLYYVYMAGLLAVGATGFTLMGLIRHRELVAMLAGGVSMFRIAAPIIVIGFATNVLLFVDQEYVIPPLKQKIGRSKSDIKHGGIRPFAFYFVPDGQSWLFTGSKFDAKSMTIDDLTVLKRSPEGRLYAKVVAVAAVWNDNPGTPGWNLIQGYEIKQIFDDDTDRPVLTRDPVEVTYLPTDLDPTTLMLKRHEKFRQLLSQRGWLILNGSVSSPCRKRKSLNGLGQGPMLRMPSTRALMMKATLPIPGTSFSASQ